MTQYRPALFASAFHPHVGGVEELTRQLAREQQRRGMLPVVVTMRWPKDLPEHEIVEGVPVLREVFRVPEPSLRYFGGWALQTRHTHDLIRQELVARDVDLVHVQCVSNNARYAQAAAQTLNVPLVVTMQGELTMDATGLYQRSAQQRRAWRRLLDKADAITGCSAHVLDEASAAHPGAWQSRSRVVPNGIRLADFRDVEPWQRRPYVLGLGRLVHQKGFDLLLEAFATVARSFDVDLLLAGDGPERPRLESQALSLALGDRVHFLGMVNRHSTTRLFAGASVFVLPSRQEPQGIVVLEAMAAGAPVVASRVGGVPETVEHGENGLLFRGEDAHGLADGIAEVLNDPTLAGKLRSAARRTAELRDWSAVADEYGRVYDSTGDGLSD